MLLLTSHKVESSHQRADKRDSRFRDGERVRDVIQEYSEAENDTVDK